MKTKLIILLCTTVLLLGYSKVNVSNNQEVLNKYWYDILTHCRDYIRVEKNIIADENKCFQKVQWESNMSDQKIITKITYWYYQ